jgi:hypothetical protein
MRTPATAPAPSKWTEPARRLKQLNTLAAAKRRDLRRRHWLRLHVFVIALLTLGSLWLASAILMHAGVDSLGLRYAMALPLAYALYLLLLRLWAQWLARHGGSSGSGDGVNLDLPDFQGAELPTLDGGAGFGSGGGGDFGGGGASGSWAPDADTAKGLADAAESAGSALGGLDEGIVVAVPIAVVLGLMALLTGLLGTGVFMLFGVETLLAVTVEVALASVAGSLAYKGFTEGWLGSALRHTGRGFVAAWVLSVLLGCGVDHWIPAAQTLPQALRILGT